MIRIATEFECQGCTGSGFVTLPDGIGIDEMQNTRVLKFRFQKRLQHARAVARRSAACDVVAVGKDTELERELSLPLASFPVI